MILSVHSLPIPQYIFGWGCLLLLGVLDFLLVCFGCWVEVFLFGFLFVGGWWFMGVLSCFFFLNKVPCPVCMVFCSSWSSNASHEKQASSSELERELTTQALSEHQEIISILEVRKLFTHFSTGFCDRFCRRREPAVMPHKCEQAYQQLDLIRLCCCCFFRFALLLSPDKNEQP